MFQIMYLIISIHLKTYRKEIYRIRWHMRQLNFLSEKDFLRINHFKRKEWKRCNTKFHYAMLNNESRLTLSRNTFQGLPKHKFSILFLLLLLACYRTHYRIFTAFQSINLQKSHVKKVSFLTIISLVGSEIGV